MKKLLLTASVLCLCGMLWAQDKEKTEFKMTVGDTVVWKPFADCNTLGYNVSGPKFISFKPIHFGEKVEIIAKQAGNSHITATCTDNDSIAVAYFIVNEPYSEAAIAEKPVKPATQPFTATYNFNPPTDHFFITINDKGTQFNETYMKLGDNEAFNDGQGIDRFWNVKTGKNWYYRPEAQGWTDDVDWEFNPFGKSFFPLDAFANEVDHSKLSNYYVGNEKIMLGGSQKPMDIDCWHFFVEQKDGNVIQYWVDPANGCTLKRQVNNDPPKVVTVYDLKYTRLHFGPSFKKGLHDTTR